MRRTAVVAAAVAVVAAGGAGAWQLLRDDDRDRGAAQAFADAWVEGNLEALPWDRGSGSDPAAKVAELTARLTPAPDDRPAEVRVESVERDGDAANAALSVRWELPGEWSYRTTLPLRRSGDMWRPLLSPEVVHPELTDDAVLRARLEQAPRAPITDRAGKPLVTERPVVTVGIQPSRTSDTAATASRVAELTDVDAAALLTRVRAAKPDAFVEVITLRREAYDAQRDQLRPIPGVVLREGTRQLAPTTAFARALLGAVGPATAEIVEAGKGRVRADQQVGLSGLQKRFDEQLAGTPGLTVETAAADGTARKVLQTTPPVAGTAVQVTLDPAVQLAADEALAKAPADKAAALVVLQPSSGDVLAVANAGPDGPGADRALTGRYPPGSTFKIASTLALLRQGLAPTDAVACPATLSVEGKRFKNAEGEVLGNPPFRKDFALSCNTAFVGSADRVSSAELQQAARDVGYGELDLGVGAFGGDVPVTDDAVQHAAQMIGQGKVLASPLSAAVSAAAVADGRLRPPRVLMAEPAAAPGPELAEAGDLRELMRAVVTEGTATVLRNVPGDPVSGKTGTAEFGAQVPPQTHAWFTGFSGDLAFAVLVEDGGFGGAVAAPLAGELLRALRSS